jgi:hypothetical protein
MYSLCAAAAIRRDVSRRCPPIVFAAVKKRPLLRRTFISGPPRARPNSFGVELLPEAYQTKLFKHVRTNKLDRNVETQALRDLERFGLVSSRGKAATEAASPPPIPDITGLMPPLTGTNVLEHFEAVGREMVRPYRQGCGSRSWIAKKKVI